MASFLRSWPVATRQPPVGFGGAVVVGDGKRVQPVSGRLLLTTDLPFASTTSTPLTSQQTSIWTVGTLPAVGIGVVEVDRLDVELRRSWCRRPASALALR